MAKEVISITTSFLLLWTLFLATGFEVEKNVRGIGYAVLAGVAGCIGAIFFYRALRQGKVVVPLTTLNPLITVALSVLLMVALGAICLCPSEMQFPARVPLLVSNCVN